MVFFNRETFRNRRGWREKMRLQTIPTIPLSKIITKPSDDIKIDVPISNYNIPKGVTGLLGKQGKERLPSSND